MNPKTAPAHIPVPHDAFYTRVINFVHFFAKGISRVTLNGQSNIPPQGGAIIVPNHVSNIDPVLLGVAVSRVRPLRALAKESLFRLPVVGNVLSKMGHIPVHRGTAQGGESLATALEAIQEGRLVALYPEGTIPANHVRLGKGKTGAARLALATGAPVIPVGQWGAQHVMPLRKTRSSRLFDPLSRVPASLCQLENLSNGPCGMGTLLRVSRTNPNSLLSA